MAKQTFVDVAHQTWIKDAVAAARARIDTRLSAVVAVKLGATVVVLTHYVYDKRTGAETPVFRVPQHLIADARALGLTVHDCHGDQ